MMMPLLLLLTTTMLNAAPSASAPAINDWCPVLTDEKADPNITTIYRGRTVAFCCDRCLAKFKANPDEYVDRLPQFSASVASPQTGVASSHDRGATANQSSASATGEHHGGASHQHDVGEERAPFLGRLHPVIVHFPIAGIILAFISFAAWSLTGRDVFARADVVPLLVGTLAAVAAVITGNIAHDSMRFSASLHAMLERHQTAGTVVMILALCLSGLRIWRWNRMVGSWRWLYGIGLLAAVVLVGLTGFLGGSVVFGPDHLKW